ncbi:MAG: dnaG [Candidatus Magasanikbacteria bacterium]|nr:dnaG [Candidatus Magasanikbacteria bacterium]
MADLQEIKDRLDIVSVLGEYLQLKASGANWKGLCPFHHEKSPSFMVHREKQIWHCFGCHEGGDIFTFVMKMEGLEFVEALKLLADRAGVEISAAADVDRSERNRLLEVLKSAAQFFQKIFHDSPRAQAAREYLDHRGLKNTTIAEFGIGWSAEDWNALTDFLLKRGVPAVDIAKAGLAVKKDDGGIYDRFRGRIMFPIHDVHGNVVGFTGRVLVETAVSGGKYVNTPQTILFDKGRLLYNLHRAKQFIKDAGFAIIMEGQMDVVSAWQAGIKNVIASSGTALTPDQVNLLKRYTNKIAISFDADVAGQAAAKRGLNIARDAGLDIRVIKIPADAGKDPDDCIKKDPEIFKRAVEEAAPIMAFIIERALNGKNLADPKQKVIAAREVLTEIAALPSAIERETWLRTLGQRIAVSEDALREEMRKLGRPVAPNPAATSAESASPTITARTPAEIIEQYLLAFALHLNRDALPLMAGLHPQMFGNERNANLYTTLLALYNKVDLKDPAQMMEAVWKEQGGGDEIAVLRLLVDKDFADFERYDFLRELHATAERLERHWLDEQRRHLEDALRLAEGRQDKSQIEELIVQYQVLTDLVARVGRRTPTSL